MVRWRLCLFLAMLLILPDSGTSKGDDDDDDDSRSEDTEEDNENDDDEDEESPSAQRLERPFGRRAPAVLPTTTSVEVITRTVPRRPLECFVCAYKADTQLRSCLDPTKYRVHTMICHSAEDQCFTSVISKKNAYEAVMRGCRSGCVPSPETTCCELNRCNNQALAVPVIQPQALASARVSANKSSKTIPPSVVFFVTVLLVLQTVVKVAFV